MKEISLISFPAAILIILISVINGPGCAKIIPPEGGIDIRFPPLLLKASPPDSSSNFSEKKITLTFDEYIQLQNPIQELIMSPVPKKRSLK